MGSTEVVDVTGTARSDRDLLEALVFVERQMVREPLAATRDGMPYLIHFTVIRDVLRAELDRRSTEAAARPGGA